jgi:hypothetical protein
MHFVSPSSGERNVSASCQSDLLVFVASPCFICPVFINRVISYCIQFLFSLMILDCMKHSNASKSSREGKDQKRARRSQAEAGRRKIGTVA